MKKCRKQEKVVLLPDEILDSYLNDIEKEKFSSGEIGIYSITVYGEKPCCDPESGCC